MRSGIVDDDHNKCDGTVVVEPGIPKNLGLVSCFSLNMKFRDVVG